MKNTLKCHGSPSILTEVKKLINHTALTELVWEGVGKQSYILLIGLNGLVSVEGNQQNVAKLEMHCPYNFTSIHLSYRYIPIYTYIGN